MSNFTFTEISKMSSLTLTEIQHVQKMRATICRHNRCRNCPINNDCLNIRSEKARDRIHDEYVKMFGPPEWESDWSKEPDLDENDVLSVFE